MCRSLSISHNFDFILDFKEIILYSIINPHPTIFQMIPFILLCLQSVSHSLRCPNVASTGVSKERRPLTSAEDDAFVRYLVLGLQAGAIPALITELVLTLMDSNLDALNGRGRHIRIPHTHLHLSPG